MLAPDAAAEYLGVAMKTLANWRSSTSTPEGPEWMKVGGSVRYLRDDLDAWLANGKQTG